MPNQLYAIVTVVFAAFVEVAPAQTTPFVSPSLSLTREFKTRAYRQAIRANAINLQRAAGETPTGKMSAQSYNDKLFAMVVRKYYFNDRDEFWQSCPADMARILWAFYREFETYGRNSEPAAIEPKGIYPAHDDGSSYRHFFAGAAIEAYTWAGETAQILHEFRTNPGHYPVDAYRDDAYAFLGTSLAHEFSTWSNASCLCRVKRIATRSVSLSDFFPDMMPLESIGSDVSYQVGITLRDRWLRHARKNLNTLFEGC